MRTKYKMYAKRKAYRTKALEVDQIYNEFPDYYSLQSYIILDSSIRGLDKSDYLVEKYNYENLEWEVLGVGILTNKTKP